MTELTKKNEAYIRQLEKLLQANPKLTPEKISDTLKDVTEKVLAAQPSGQTATQLFGTPTQAAEQFVAPQDKRGKKTSSKRLHEYGFWTLALDTAMAITILFAGVFGLSGIFTPNSTEGTGITSLILIALFGGVVYTRVVLALTPNPSAPHNLTRGRRATLLALAMLGWLAGFLALSLLPRAINPVLPGWTYLILAVVAFGVFRWNRQKSGLRGGFFAISQLSLEARQAAAQKESK
ncbi:MAG TPA: DUF1129 family protein [Lactobacillaceae bacterium]|jgi:uncharacterized membrane-anchored protein